MIAKSAALPIEAKHEPQPANLKIAGEANRIVFTNGCNVNTTLEKYIKERDTVCAEQEAKILHAHGEAATLLAELNGLDATEPNYALL